MSMQPTSYGNRPSGGIVIDAAARWLSHDEEIELGCECANPSLQIERWGKDESEPAMPLQF